MKIEKLKSKDKGLPYYAIHEGKNTRYYPELGGALKAIAKDFDSRPVVDAKPLTMDDLKNTINHIMGYKHVE